MNLELAPQFVQDVDWRLLKKQKQDLIKVINSLELDFKEAYMKNDKAKGDMYMKRKASMEGVLNLIDGLQDYAVDICGVPENEVF